MWKTRGLNRLEEHCQVDDLDLNPSVLLGYFQSQTPLIIPLGEWFCKAGLLYDIWEFSMTKLLFDSLNNSTATRAPQSLAFAMRGDKDYARGKTIKYSFAYLSAAF